MTITKNIIADYPNGNVNVLLYSDGSKTLEWDGTAQPKFPVSIDVKITNWCDNKICGKYCHEQSNKSGLHCNVENLFAFLKDLPAGTELAIGGGDTFAHPDIERIIKTLRREYGHVPNATVNSVHIKRHLNLISSLRKSSDLFGLGVSYIQGIDASEIVDENTVYHVIAGVHNHWKIMRLPKGSKILILGYKQYGNGVTYYQLNPIDKIVHEWNCLLPSLAARFRLSFDNLAVKQLKIKDKVSDKIWNTHYMGEDGTFTMYYDAVREEYAVGSTYNRIPKGNLTIQEVFEKVRNS